MAPAMLCLPEPQAARFVSDMEQSPCFDVLRPFIRRKEPFLARCRLPSIESALQGLPMDARTDIFKFQTALDAIRRIGRDALERHFLYDAQVLRMADIARSCAISCDEASAIQALLLHISIHPARAGAGELSCLGQVCLKDSFPYLVWHLPHLARGPYRLDREGIAAYLRAQRPDPAGRKRIRRLLNDLEGVNLLYAMRMSILQDILWVQGPFFRSARRMNLVELPPRVMASRLGCRQNTVGRFLGSRSLEIPWGEELPLAELLPDKSKRISWAIREILAAALHENSDEEIRKALWTRYRLPVSRRMVHERRRFAVDPE